MANITLSIPEILHARMQEHSEYKWSEIARKAIEQKIDEAEFLDDLRAISKAEKEHKKGRTTSHRQLIKELGLENEL
ncbi:MAG: hypothetical protein NTX79_00620 [Candidatus Micrarchaeota archaeon]|nr:hypothetical protein [Candidatus Micrarchaeota archaeon]